MDVNEGTRKMHLIKYINQLSARQMYGTTYKDAAVKVLSQVFS